MASILLLNGPNLNLLGTREPGIYGADTLESIVSDMGYFVGEHGHNLSHFQSNDESALVDRVQQALTDGTAFIVINPAAFTHTSVALRDALAAVAIPFIEVHLSNPMSREPFRHTSYFSDLAVGVVSGFGAHSYRYALDAAMRLLR